MIATATETLPLTELAVLAGVPAPELRRLARGSRQDTPHGDGASGEGVTPESTPGNSAAATSTPEPVAAAG